MEANIPLSYKDQNNEAKNTANRLMSVICDHLTSHASKSACHNLPLPAVIVLLYMTVVQTSRLKVYVAQSSDVVIFRSLNHECYSFPACPQFCVHVDACKVQIPCDLSSMNMLIHFSLAQTSMFYNMCTKS